jgi:hypothetical protein
MAHFAKIEDGVVVDVIVVDNQHEAYGEAYLHGLGLDGRWVQTSYNGRTRGKYAHIGDTYDEELDEFVSPARQAEPTSPAPQGEPIE